MAGERFYLPHYENAPDRPVYLQDIGSYLFISGIVLQGMGSTLVLLTPTGEIPDSPVKFERPSLSDWTRIIQQSDNPELFIGQVGQITKVLHRKQRYAISGNVQQRVWARDGFKCVYCNAQMGKVLMTIDHFVPLEQGGTNDERNYVSACRPCNKAKGMMMPDEFCMLKGFDFQYVRDYVKGISNGDR